MFRTIELKGTFCIAYKLYSKPLLSSTCDTICKELSANEENLFSDEILLEKTFMSAASLTQLTIRFDSDKLFIVTTDRRQTTY